MCIYSPMPHTLSYCALIGECALIGSNTVSGMMGELGESVVRRHNVKATEKLHPQLVIRAFNIYLSGLEKSSVLPVLDRFLKLKTDLSLDKKLKNRSIKPCISQDFAIHRLTLSPVRTVHT